ncbi:MAG TPA: DUF948 domain-containing protein [Candidatus Acidoferrum sp.]|jgi:hypothetical protein
MENWVAVFVVVAACAIVFQAGILIALFFQMRRTMDRVDQLTTEMQSRLGPILTRVQLLLDETQPKISEMISDASHIVYLARGQAQKVDRVMTEASDRLRGQVVRADRILTGALEAVEDAGSTFRKSVWGPMHKASALVQGIKVGLDFLRARRGVSPASASDGTSEQEEELFI